MTASIIKKPHPQPLSQKERGAISPSPVGEGDQGDEVLGDEVMRDNVFYGHLIRGQPVDPLKKELSRRFRKRATYSEHILWEKLRKRKLAGIKFRRQQIIHGYIVDFYCSEKKLVVEIDGGIHTLTHEYDNVRDKIFQQMGISVIRLKAEDVEQNIKRVLTEIKTCLMTPHPQPLSQKEKEAISPSPVGEGDQGDEVMGDEVKGDKVLSNLVKVNFHANP